MNQRFLRVCVVFGLALFGSFAFAEAQVSRAIRMCLGDSCTMIPLGTQLRVCDEEMKICTVASLEDPVPLETELAAFALEPEVGLGRLQAQISNEFIPRPFVLRLVKLFALLGREVAQYELVDLNGESVIVVAQLRGITINVMTDDDGPKPTGPIPMP